MWLDRENGWLEWLKFKWYKRVFAVLHIYFYIGLIFRNAFMRWMILCYLSRRFSTTTPLESYDVIARENHWNIPFYDFRGVKNIWLHTHFFISNPFISIGTRLKIFISNWVLNWLKHQATQKKYLLYNLVNSDISCWAR